MLVHIALAGVVFQTCAGLMRSVVLRLKLMSYDDHPGTMA